MTSTQMTITTEFCIRDLPLTCYVILAIIRILIRKRQQLENSKQPKGRMEHTQKEQPQRGNQGRTAQTHTIGQFLRPRELQS